MQRPNASAASALLALSLLALHFPPAVAQQSKVAPKLVSTIDESLDYRWSPDGKSLAVRGYEDVSLYDAASGKARAVIKVEALWPLPKSVNFTPDGRTLVVQTDRVRLYDAADGRLLREFGERTSPISIYEKVNQGYTSSELNSSTGQYEDVQHGPSKEQVLQELPTEYLSDRVISPDGRSLLVRGEAGKALVYDTGTGALRFTLEPLVEPGAKANAAGAGAALGEFSPDGRRIVTSHRNRTPRLWDAETGALVADLAPQSGAVYGVSFSHDGRYVATTSFDGVVKIWDAAAGKLLHTLGTGANKDRHYFAVWNPADDTFVTKTREWQVGVWDARTGAPVCRLDGNAVKEKFDLNNTFLFSPDGRLLVTQARNDFDARSFVSFLTPIRDKKRFIAHVWDARTGAPVASLRDTKGRNGADYYRDKFVWNPSGDILVTAGLTVKLWSRRGELLQEIEDDPVRQAGLSPDGRLLAYTLDYNVSMAGMTVELAKLLVGKPPKWKPLPTYVWQIAAN